MRNLALVNLSGENVRELIGLRLKEERERLSYSQVDFAAAGGASKRSQIDWEQGKLVPNAEFLALVAGLGVDVQYVLTGVASTATLTSDEQELVVGYRALDIRGKANMLGMLDVVGTTPKVSAKPVATPRTGSQFLGKIKAKHVTQGDQHIAGDFNNGDSKKAKKPKKNLEE